MGVLDVPAPHDAAHITVDPVAAGIASTNVQDGFTELGTRSHVISDGTNVWVALGTDATSGGGDGGGGDTGGGG